MSDTEPDHLFEGYDPVDASGAVAPISTAVLEVDPPELTDEEREALANQRATDLMTVADAIRRQAPHTRNIKIPENWRRLNDGHKFAFLKAAENLHSKARAKVRALRKKRRGWA